MPISLEDLRKRIASKEAESLALKTKTPLAVYLTIYANADKECFIEYMYGAELLYNWLSPIDLTPPKNLIPTNFCKHILSGHEVSRLTDIFTKRIDHTSADDYFKTHDLVKRTIITTYLNLINFLPEDRSEETRGIKE